MLTHPTSERLRSLGLVAMAQALEEQRRQPDLEGLGFEERLALLVEREATGREDKRLRARLKFAGLRQSACVEDIDWRAARGLDRALFQRLAAACSTTACRGCWRRSAWPAATAATPACSRAWRGCTSSSWTTGASPRSLPRGGAT